VALATDGMTSAQLERVGRGSYLVNAVMACVDCHDGPAGHMAGGLPWDLGLGWVVNTRNVTPDPASGLTLTEDEFIEAIRTGRDFKAPGSSLAIMPWADFRWAATEDLRSVYAYLKVIPPVNNVVPADENKPVAAPVPFPDMFNDGEVDRVLPDESSPDDGYGRRGLAVAALDYSSYFDTLSGQEQWLFGRGAYLVQIGLCSDCHTNNGLIARHTFPGIDNSDISIQTGDYLRGGQVFPIPPPPLPPPAGDEQLHTRSMSQNLIGGTRGHFLVGYAETYEFFTSLAWPDNAQPIAFPMIAYLIQNYQADDILALWTFMNAMAVHDPQRDINDKAPQRVARYCDVDGDCNATAGENCNTATHECVGKGCSVDADCDVCQTCGGGTCDAPAADSSCLALGL